MITPLLLSIIAFCFSLTLTQLTRLFATYVGAVDQPADRKTHQSPVPRLGGVAVVGAFAGTFLVANLADFLPNELPASSSPLAGALLFGGGLIFLCGIWDDLSPLSAKTKFIAEFIAAALAVWFGVHLDRIALAGDYVFDLGVLSVPVTILWIVGITNAFNLIDGLDGLATGLGSIAAGTCAAIFLYVGATDDATILCLLLGALLGFLPFNFYPAKIFLGDSGSLVLGYLLSIIVITGSQKYATATAVIIPLLTFGVPIIDTLLSMVRRMAKKQFRQAEQRDSWKSRFLSIRQMFMADRDHIHHRLMARGLSHRRAVLTLYAASAALSGLALLALLAEYRNALLLLLTVAMATAIGIAKLGYLEGGASRIGTAFQKVDGLKFNRTFFFGFADLLLVTVAYWGAYAILVGRDGVPSVRQWYVNMFPIVCLVQLSVFWVAGLYRGLWRAVDVGDLLRVAIAVCVGGALSFSFVAIYHPPLEGNLFVVHTLLLGWLTGGLRSAYRLADYSRFFGVSVARPALIYGAGLGGRLLLRELRQNEGRGFQAIGFIDDNPSLQGRIISGIPVLGGGRDLAALIQEKQIDSLLVSSSTITGPLLQQALMICQGHGVEAFRSEYLFKSLVVGHVENMPSVRIAAVQDRILELRRRSDLAPLGKTAP